MVVEVEAKVVENSKKDPKVEAKDLMVKVKEKVTKESGISSSTSNLRNLHTEVPAKVTVMMLMITNMMVGR